MKGEAKRSMRHFWIPAFLFLSIVILTHHLDKYLGREKPLRPPFLKVTNKLITISQPIVTVPANEVFSCKPHPLSLADSLEERLLLDSNRWPETPSIQANYSLEKTSNPRGSNYVILPKEGGQQWHIGDQLKVRIQMKDFKGNPKTTGGDFITARLHNPLLYAGVTGQVEDHLNGSYSAVFPLLWKGSAAVEVTLIHASEAITVLRRLTKELPDRVKFTSIFRQGKEFETSTCNVCLRPTKEPICNFTDIRTGDPWFCYKPKKLECDTRATHTMQGFSASFGPYAKLFLSKINMKVSIPSFGVSSINVRPTIKGVRTSPKINQPGYYYKGVWQTLTGAPVQQFNTPAAISKCLEKKKIYLYGDSTVRQWYEYLTGTIPDLKPFNINSMKGVGPFMAIDYRSMTIGRYRLHGIPIEHRPPPVPVTELRYVANELDSLVGGANTVVVIGVWAHFGTIPTEFYIRRLQSIRRSVIRLLKRAPDTLVVIRASNLRYLTPSIAWSNSDFASMERDKILRAVFKSVNVSWVDAWEMTMAHSLPHELHPKPPIVKNMINVLLSYICPGMKS